MGKGKAQKWDAERSSVLADQTRAFVGGSGTPSTPELDLRVRAAPRPCPDQATMPPPFLTAGIQAPPIAFHLPDSSPRLLPPAPALLPFPNSSLPSSGTPGPRPASPALSRRSSPKPLLPPCGNSRPGREHHFPRGPLEVTVYPPHTPQGWKAEWPPPLWWLPLPDLCSSSLLKKEQKR